MPPPIGYHVCLECGIDKDSKAMRKIALNDWFVMSAMDTGGESVVQGLAICLPAFEGG